MSVAILCLTSSCVPFICSSRHRIWFKNCTKNTLFIGLSYYDDIDSVTEIMVPDKTIFNICPWFLYYGYKKFYVVKNCTKDTLLLNLSAVETLSDWKYWNEQLQGINLPIEKDESKMDFYKATIGTLVVPNSKIDVSPDVFRPKDTCYIYVVKLNIAQHYPMKEIRRRRLYDRRMVTKKDFRNHLFEYRTSGIKDSPLVH